MKMSSEAWTTIPTRIPPASSNAFGKPFEVGTPTPAPEAVATIKSGKEFKGVMEGRMLEICQNAGCWANIELPSGEKIKVKFRDANGDEFGIDKNASGKMIDVHGVGYMDTVSVAMLRHYAEDDKATKEEIEAIKEPKISATFTADGAVIK